jgi:hypothetical protein
MKRTALLTLLSFATALAQSPTFDVASVKPSPPSGDLLNINLGTFSHGVVTLTNTTLSECIQYAYGLVSEDLINGPDWIRDHQLRVEIIAKTAPGTPLDQAITEVRYIPGSDRTGYVRAWHFTVEHELPGNLLLDVAYVGNHDVGDGVF